MGHLRKNSSGHLTRNPNNGHLVFCPECPTDCGSCADSYSLALAAGEVLFCAMDRQWKLVWGAQSVTVTRNVGVSCEWDFGPDIAFESTLYWRDCASTDCPAACAGDWTLEGTQYYLISTFCASGTWLITVSVYYRGTWIGNIEIAEKAVAVCPDGTFSDGSVIS